MEQYIGFSLGSEEYMIPILKVREIITIPKVTALPQLPPYMRGVTNLRGTVIPIVDLLGLLDSQSTCGDGKTVIVLTTGKITFGVIVDGITGVLKLDSSQIDAPERFINNALDQVDGVARLEDRLVVLLNINKLLPVDDMSLLEDALMNVHEVEDSQDVEIVKEIDTIGGKVTITELHNAKDYFRSRLDKDDPKHAVYELMLSFMDALARNDYERIEEIATRLNSETESDIFREVGRITRNLHDSLEEFKGALNRGISRLSKNDVPKAVDKLHFVISKTEDAANKTMAIVERYFQESQELSAHIEKIRYEDEAKYYLRLFKESLDSDMTGILTAQQFQDITGQTIRKVIDLVNNVEEELVKLITKFGTAVNDHSEEQPVGVTASQEEGADSASDERLSQTDVEALLNDFGF